MARQKLSLKRRNILQRVRRYNEKLAPDEQSRIKYGMNYNELRQLETTLRTKLKASKSGFDVSEIPKTLPKKQRENLERLAHAKKVQNKSLEVKTFNDLVKQNKQQIQKVKKQFKQLKGFDGADFIRHAFYKKGFRTPDEFLRKDTAYLYESLYTKDMFKDYLDMIVKKANEYLEDSNLPKISKNLSQEEIIKKLNNLDTTTKKIIGGSPTDLYFDDIDLRDEYDTEFD